MCGIFGVVGLEGALQYCIFGLRNLQHRGQESYGIVIITKDGRMVAHHASGLVNESEIFKALSHHGDDIVAALGHVRYSTSGGKYESYNVQPLIETFRYVGDVAIAHNGNFTNADQLRKELESDGFTFKTTMDTEVFAKLMAQSDARDLEGKIRYAANKVEGGFALIIASKDHMFAIRDVFGIRPLIYGRADNVLGIAASETCALNAILGNMSDREISDLFPGYGLSTDLLTYKNKPGEIFVSTIPQQNIFPMITQKPTARGNRFCLFEYVYFARPDSVMNGISVYKSRKEVGRLLAKKYPVEGADMAVPVPDASTDAAIGYSEVSGIPLERAIIKNTYVNRTFITVSKQRERALGIKHNINGTIVQGKKIVVIDDSLVRSNTARNIVTDLRRFGAKEVHMRIASPPVKYCCYYGIDTPHRNELIASHLSKEAICKKLGLDSLEYIDVEDLREAAISGTSVPKNSFCDACFTGDYFAGEIREIAVKQKKFSVQQGSVVIAAKEYSVVYKGGDYFHDSEESHIASYDLNLIKSSQVFNQTMRDYSLFGKTAGIYIFFSKKAGSLMDYHHTGDDALNAFLTHCKIVDMQNDPLLLESEQCYIGGKGGEKPTILTPGPYYLIVSSEYVTSKDGTYSVTHSADSRPIIEIFR